MTERPGRAAEALSTGELLAVLAFVRRFPCSDRMELADTARCSTMATPWPISTSRGASSIRTSRGFTQLGSVWLPLPHMLLLPFVQIYSWWANGLRA